MTEMATLSALEVARNLGRAERAGECQHLRGEIERLRALIKDLADDLESELNGRYCIKRRGSHSVVHRRYERDMALVYEARRVLDRPLPSAGDK